MRTKVFSIISLVVMLSATALAQNNEQKFALEFNSGVSFPLSEIENSKLSAGFGFEGLFHYRFQPHLGVYAGWGWNRLSAEESFAGNDMCFEETGYVFGFQFAHPIGESPLSYYVRGGGLYNHLETENADGDIINDTGHGLGYQIAGGLSFKVGKNWSLNPGIKFNSLSRDTEFEGVTRKLDYKYLGIRVGIVKNL